VDVDEARQHCANPICPAEQALRIVLRDEVHDTNGFDMDGNFTGFAASLCEPLPFLPFRESVGPFPNERHGFAGCAKELVSKAAIAARDLLGDRVDVSEHLERHAIAVELVVIETGRMRHRF
jgi:hypothetical protein